MADVLAVQIKVGATGRGKMIINGVDLSNRVSKASFEVVACRLTKITLELWADRVEVDSEAVVTVLAPDDTQEADAVR